jgi:hypothetical protein
MYWMLLPNLGVVGIDASLPLFMMTNSNFKPLKKEKEWVGVGMRLLAIAHYLYSTFSDAPELVVLALSVSTTNWG